MLGQRRLTDPSLVRQQLQREGVKHRNDLRRDLPTCDQSTRLAAKSQVSCRPTYHPLKLLLSPSLIDSCITVIAVYRELTFRRSSFSSSVGCSLRQATSSTSLLISRRTSEVTSSLAHATPPPPIAQDEQPRDGARDLLVQQSLLEPHTSATRARHLVHTSVIDD